MNMTKLQLQNMNVALYIYISIDSLSDLHPAYTRRIHLLLTLVKLSDHKPLGNWWRGLSGSQIDGLCSNSQPVPPSKLPSLAMFVYIYIVQQV